MWGQGQSANRFSRPRSAWQGTDGLRQGWQTLVCPSGGEQHAARSGRRQRRRRPALGPARRLPPHIGAAMPSTDGAEHQPQLGLPPNTSGDSPLWVIRFSGEVFADYE